MTEHVNSYYAASANKHAPYPTLTEQLECDVCVIGAGYTGLSSVTVHPDGIDRKK
ncbi:hypothetical protein ACET6I_13690 [Aeromonas veronii]